MICGEKFVCGVNVYFMFGDLVCLGVDEDFELIFGLFDVFVVGGKYLCLFLMGCFVVDIDFEVCVLGKEFFSKYIVVMGNLGLGKLVIMIKILYEVL